MLTPPLSRSTRLTQRRKPRKSRYVVDPADVPGPLARTGPYSVRFALDTDDLHAVQRLRYEVFNLELGEGLDESHRTGLDRDRFDPVCHHLMVEGQDGGIVGTYRMQTYEMATSNAGFYSHDEFRLEAFPPGVLDSAVELGRASVARTHRNRQVLFLLWRGLAAYLVHHRKTRLFGCCSLTSQDPPEGQRVMEYLRRRGHIHAEWNVTPQPDWVCYEESSPGATVADEETANEHPKIELPKLFSLYLRYGAKVCGPPAIDRFFKTIDYLVLLDVEHLSPDSRAMFFG